MGEVFLADDHQLERKVALKFLPDELQDDPVARGRFEREAKSAAALDHPFICKIHEFTQIDGRPCIVMEHVAGQTLEARLVEGALAPAEAIQIAAEIAEALTEAHAHRILHRDLKPANLMLTGQGHVKVMDFGLAKRMRDPGASDSQDLTPGSLTATGTLLGTPAYMAPEQVRGEPADTRSDVFSFGVVLFELLTREHPFKRGTVIETIAAILRDPPSGGAGSGAQIDYAIFDKLLAKTPDDRYQSFEDVSVEVRRLRDVSSTWTEPVSAVEDDGESTVGSRRTPFVGRDAEQAELGRWLDRAARGRGGLVLVGGEPGVGKTRLVEQVLETARQQRCLTLTGRCYEMEGTAPFMPFVEIIEHYTRVAPSEVLRETLGDAAPEVARLVPDLRRVFPDIPPPLELPPEQQRHYLFKNVSEFLERMSRVSSTVLLLDDLQWADNATLLLLQHLAPLLWQLPVLALGTYRDVELDVNRPFAKTLETLNRKRLAQRLNLERLPQEGVAGMLAALGGASPPEALVVGIYRETEGNPFFVEEVYQHLEDEGVLRHDDGTWRSELDLAELDVPEGVRLVIGRRLERVSADSRKVLTFGAVVGRGFSLELLEAVGDVTGDALLTALEEAEANYLVTPMRGREPRWEFSHALIRQTLAAGLSLPRRQRLHLKVADAIERAAGSAADRHAADLAHHLFQAGTAAEPAKTVRFLALAGDQALGAGAFDEALRRFNDALSIHDEDDQRQIADLRYGKGQALRSVGRTEEALAEWNVVQSACITLHDEAAILRVTSAAWYALAWAGEIAAASHTTQRGLDALDANVSTERCLMLALEGVSRGFAGQPGGEELFEESMSMAADISDDKVLAEVLRHKSWHHWYWTKYSLGRVTARDAAALLRSMSNLWDLADVIALPAVTSAFHLGHLAESAALVEEVEPLAERTGHSGAAWFASMFKAMHQVVLTGDIDALETFSRAQVELGQQTSFGWRYTANLCLGLVHMYRGQWRDAEAINREAVDLEPRGCFMTGNAPGALLLAQVHSAPATAAQELRRSAVELASLDQLTVGRWEQLLGTVEGLASLGDSSAAAELYPFVSRGLDRGAVIGWFCLSLVQTVAGIAAAAGKQWDAAQGHFETALGQADELPHKIAQPEVRRWYARMLLDRNASGDRDKARTLLGEAVEMYEAIGMPRHVEMAKELLKLDWSAYS